MNGKKVLISGGLGNLGSKITIYLVNLGYEIYVLSRKAKNKIENVEYKVVEADVSNLDELKQKLNFEIDFCVHTASFNEFFLPGYPEKALKVNALGTRNLLEALSGKNIKNFIYFSTFHVYGADSGIIKESSQLNPKNDYASTHLFAEYYVKQFGFTHGLQYTILRLTNSYGSPTFVDSNKWYLVLNDLTRSAYENGRIIIKSNGKAKRDYIYMDDVASVVDKLLQRKATNDIYNLSSNKSYTVLELAKIVKSYYEKKYNKIIEVEVNQMDLKIYGDIEVKNDKLKSIIDFKVTDKITNEVSKIFDLLKSRK
jgi:UDP-glucose 4-epimerase